MNAGTAVGAHVAIAHSRGHAVAPILIRGEVIDHSRAPDATHFGWPLYTRFSAVWDAVATLAAALDAGDFGADTAAPVPVT